MIEAHKGKKPGGPHYPTPPHKNGGGVATKEPGPDVPWWWPDGCDWLPK